MNNGSGSIMLMVCFTASGIGLLNKGKKVMKMTGQQQIVEANLNC